MKIIKPICLWRENESNIRFGTFNNEFLVEYSYLINLDSAQL